MILTYFCSLVPCYHRIRLVQILLDLINQIFVLHELLERSNRSRLLDVSLIFAIAYKINNFISIQPPIDQILVWRYPCQIQLRTT